MEGKAQAQGTFFTRNQVTIREITAVLVLLASFFQNVVSSFLSVFVPQRCSSSQGSSFSTVNNVTALSREGDCTFSENVYEDIGPYNMFVLIINGLTCAGLSICFYVEWRREIWIIERFDVSESKGAQNLRSELTNVVPTDTDRLMRVSALRAGLAGYNLWYKRCFLAFVFLFLFNVVVSGVLVFHYFYLDYRTVTTFISSIALVVSRVYYALFTAFDCVEHEKAECTNLSVPLSFNVIRDDQSNPDRVIKTRLGVWVARERGGESWRAPTRGGVAAAGVPEPEPPWTLNPVTERASSLRLAAAGESLHVK